MRGREVVVGAAGSWPATNFRPLAAARLMSIIVNLFRGIYHEPAPGTRPPHKN